MPVVRQGPTVGDVTPAGLGSKVFGPIVRERVVARADQAELVGQETGADAVAWCQAQGANLSGQQQELIAAVYDHRKLVVPSGNGTGKTTAVAWLTRSWLRRQNSMVVTTSNTEYQVKNNIWGAIRKMAAAHGWRPMPGRMSWEPAANRRAIGIATDNVDAFQGLRDVHTLVLADESSGPRIDVIYDAIERLAVRFGAHIALIGNPTRRTGVFADAIKGRLGFQKLTLSGLDCVAWQDKHGEIPGLIDGHTLDLWRDEYGEESDFWRISVLGELPIGESAGLFLWAALEAAGEHDPAPELSYEEYRDELYTLGHRWRLGIDAARGAEGDEQVAVARLGPLMEYAWPPTRGKTHAEVFDLLRLWVAEVEQENIEAINIDATGEGSGLADFAMVEWPDVVDRVHFNGRALEPAKYANRKAEGYFGLKEHLDGGGMLPDDNKLYEDLEAHEPYTRLGKGGARVWDFLPKDRVKAAIGRSPDRGDAAALTCVPSQKTVAGGFVV